MAIASILTKAFRLSVQQNAKGVSGVVGEFKGPFVLDITYDETIELDAEPTMNPVESGPDVTDNVRVKPVVININGFVSETPLDLNSSLAGLAGAAGGQAGKLLGGFGESVGNVAGGFLGAKLLGSGQDPAQAARDMLEDLINKKSLVTVVTKRKTYTDMMLTSVRFPRDASSGGGLKLSLRFQRITLVKAKTVMIKNIAKGSSGAASKSKLGNQSPKVPTAEQSAKGSSILFKLKSAVGF